MNAVIILNRIKWHLDEIYKLRSQLNNMLYFENKDVVDTQLKAVKEILDNGNS